MLDYSKFFQNIGNIDSSYGFITKLEIVGDKVHVWTAETKKGEPHKYPISELPYYQKRLENQYRTIIDNKEIVKKDLKTKLNKKTLIYLWGVCAPISIAITITSLILSWPYLLLLILPALMAVTGGLVEKKNLKNFDEQMIVFEKYLNERKKIESLSKKDENITENLNRTTNKRIKTNEELKANGTIKDVFDIDLMDKTSLKQLSKLILKYQISQGLHTEQAFIEQSEFTEEPTGRSKKRIANKNQM